MELLCGTAWRGPWASGSAPLAALENNSALFGTVNWNGALLGVTPSAETVAGHARLALELSTLDGQLDFTGLEHWGVKKAPGRVGSGATWGDGDLEYSIRGTGKFLLSHRRRRRRGHRRVFWRGPRGDGRRARTERSGRGLRRYPLSVNGGAKRDHRGGVRRDHLAAAGLSPSPWEGPGCDAAARAGGTCGPTGSSVGLGGRFS